MSWISQLRFSVRRCALPILRRRAPREEPDAVPRLARGDPRHKRIEPPVLDVVLSLPTTSCVRPLSARPAYGCSTVSRTPDAASFRLAPWVVLVISITTP